MSRPIRDLENAVNLSERHLQAIGEVAVRWSELEDTIKEIVWDLAYIRQSSAYAITAHINESMLVNIAKSLVDLLVTGPETKLAQDIVSLLDFIISDLYGKRNAMVHSVWGISHESGKTQILPIRARRKLKFGPRQDYSADDIFSIARQIYEANEKLWDYVFRLKELIPTWNHIQRS